MKRLIQLSIILAVLNIAVAAGLWYGFTVMKEKKDLETKLHADIAEEQQKWKKLAVLRRAIVLAEKDRDAYAKNFYDPSEESQIKFITEIERLGTTTGAIVKTETFDYARNEPRSFRGSFSLTGSWEELYHTLRLIEEYPGKMVVNRFDAIENAPSVERKYSYWTGTLSIELMSIKAAE